MKKLEEVLKNILCGLLILLYFFSTPAPLSAMSIGEERIISERLLFSVRNEFPVLDDPDIHQYINNLGKEVLSFIGPQYFEYHFFIVESSQFNAFAAPGGLVFFYTGLIETMKTEDELLSVLAHEIGHVVSRHIAQRLDKSGKISVATLAVGLASLALGIPALSQGLLTGSLAAGQVIQLEYSRNDEEQADRLSYQWMQKMYRNPKSMEGMLRTMRRITRYRSGVIPQYLLTHPNPENRLAYVQSLVESDEKQHQAYYQKTDNFKFLRFKYRIFQESIDTEKMRIYCSNALSSPKNEEEKIMGHYGMALLETEELKFEKALEHLEIVKKAYPDEYILEIDQAVIFMQSGQLDKARKILLEIVKIRPESTYGLFQLAKNEYLMGKLTSAERYFKSVAAQMPEYPQVFYELGRLNSDKGNQDLSRYFLGKYYLYSGKVKAGKQYIAHAIKNNKVPEKYRKEGEAILERLKRLETKE